MPVGNAANVIPGEIVPHDAAFEKLRIFPAHRDASHDEKGRPEVLCLVPPAVRCRRPVVMLRVGGNAVGEIVTGGGAGASPPVVRALSGDSRIARVIHDGLRSRKAGRSRASVMAIEA